MGVNQQIFERYVNGDEKVLVGMPVQRQAKFRQLREVLSQFFQESPEAMQLSFDVALTGTQNSLMAKCNAAIEELDATQFRSALDARANYDAILHTLSENYYVNLETDSLGYKYDEKHGWRTGLEEVLDSYKKPLDGCNKILVRTVNGFYARGASELVAFFPEIWKLPTSIDDLQKMSLLAKLFVFRKFFGSLKLQIAQNILIAREKNNSDAAIARALETDSKKLGRMLKTYQTRAKDSEHLDDGAFVMKEPMKAASAQEKLFAERKDKPEYAFVAYLLSHQTNGIPCDFQKDLMREFLRMANYCSYALAIRHDNEDPRKPINAYLFKLRIMNNFLREYDCSITPAYECLKRLKVRDDLIRCVLYEDSKEFKKRVERARRSA